MPTQPITRICFWWSIACKSILPVFEAANQLPGVSCRVVCARGVSPSRKKLGWTESELPDFPIEVLADQGWEGYVTRVVGEESDSFHLLNSHYSIPKLNFAIDLLNARNIPYGLITESPINMESGWRSLAKQVYVDYLLRFQRPEARRKAIITYGLSGPSASSMSAFERAGWKTNRVLPFGYFPARSPLGSERTRSLNDVPWLFCSGVIERIKGHALLIDALSGLAEEGLTDWKLHVTGYGRQRELLERLVNRRGLSKHIEFTGVLPVERYQALLADSDLVVAPGYREPWGIRVNEALLAGVPVVVSDGLGAACLVRESGAGLVFRSGSASELAASIRQALTSAETRIEWKRRIEAYRHQIEPAAAARYLVDTLQQLAAGASHGAISTSQPSSFALWARSVESARP